MDDESGPASPEPPPTKGRPAHPRPDPDKASSMETRADAREGDIATLELIDGTGRMGRAPLLWLHTNAAGAIGALGLRGEVRVKIVGDDEMAAAHDRYSGVPGTTDVLTFDLRDEGADCDEGGGPLDTDLLVCLDEAGRRAAEIGHSVERELLLYILHGVLHCAGHDDTDEASAARMHAEEDRVLGAIGVGATYEPVRGGTTDPGRDA